MQCYLKKRGQISDTLCSLWLKGTTLDGASGTGGTSGEALNVLKTLSKHYGTIAEY